MPGAQISGLTVRQKSRGILRGVEQDLSRRQECTVGEESMARKLRMWLALLFMAGSIKGDVKSKHISRTDRRGVVRHRALGGICRLSVWTWAETANIPVLVLSELRLHKLLGLDSQPWFYLRLKGLQVYWVVRGGIRRLSRKEKKNSYNGTDKSVPFPEPGREASCPSLTPAW